MYNSYDPSIGFYNVAYTPDGQPILQVYDPNIYGELQIPQVALPTTQQLAHQPSPLPFGAQSVLESTQTCNQTYTAEDLLKFFDQDEIPETPETPEVTNLRNFLEPDSTMLSPYSSTEVLPSIRSLTPDVNLPPPINIVKSQYPYTEVLHRPYAAHQPTSLTLPSMHLPRLIPQRQTLPATRMSFEDSPPSSPPPHSNSPKRNKKNYTKEFNNLFQDCLKVNDHAANEWHLYSQRHKGKCTIKRAPCIKVSRGFCASYGREFADLAREEKYGALGTRTECNCKHKPAQLCSSSAPSVHKKQRVRSTPYPLPPLREVCTQDVPELPSSPEAQLNFPRPAQSSPLTKQAWKSYLDQQAAILHEGFNAILGGAQCTACRARRAFASRNEVVKYLLGEAVPCTQAGCAGSMQVHQ